MYYVNPSDIGTILRINITPNGAPDVELPLSNFISSSTLVFNYKAKNSELQKVLRIDLVEGGNVEFTYLEVKNEKVEFTHAMQIDINEFVVLKKMLEV